MSNLVTITQAKELKNLGYNEEKAARYAYRFDMNMAFKLQQGYILTKNSEHPQVLSVPTVDEAIDWLRKRYSIVIANKTIPFVNPTNGKIQYAFTVKWCNLRDGWNGRIIIGHSIWSYDIYASKRNAIWLAIRHLKKQKKCKR